VASVEVVAGVCGLTTRIVSIADEDLTVSLAIESDCAHIRQLAEQIERVSALEELRKPIHETTPYRLAGACRAHVACPVPSAILKAVEVACGMALPADVHMTIRRD